MIILFRPAPYPLTGVGCVDRLYAHYGIFDVGPGSVRIPETFGIDTSGLWNGPA